MNGRAVLVVALMLGIPAFGQGRLDITPLLGYRSTAYFETTNEDGSAGVEAKLQNGGSVGAAVGFRYEDTAVIEFRYARQNTSTTLSGLTGVPGTQSVGTRLEQYHGDFTREFPSDARPGLRPFVIASVGMSRLSWGARSESRFSFGIGGGIKFFPVKWFGLRVQTQWLPIWMNPEVKGFACGGGCAVAIGGKLAGQGEVSFGPTFSF